MTPIAKKARMALINMGKCLPFVMCAMIAISYTENVISLATNDFVLCDGVTIPNKPVSWLIGQIFEYNIYTLIVIVVISFAIETCRYNKIACMYLIVNLYEKSYFDDNECCIEVYYYVSVANIIVCAWLCYKGINILTKNY